MNTLKYFILLIGLFALVHTNLNAQPGPATATGPVAIPDLTMALPMSSGSFDGSSLVTSHAVAYSTLVSPTVTSGRVQKWNHPHYESSI